MIEVIALDSDLEIKWDEFCANAINSTFQHTRLFLSYHGKRFNDQSVLLVENEKIIGLFPAAAVPDDEYVVVNHPGAAHGGILHQGRLLGNKMIDAITALKSHYYNLGYRTILYKALPFTYQAMPAQDDIYALFRHNATRIRCDLSCTIELTNRRRISSRRKRGVRKAHKSVAISTDIGLLNDLYSVIVQNLSRKHGAQPVHSVAELNLLYERFPKNLIIHCALIENKVEAGVLFFNTPTVWHAQYIASSERGYNTSALDAVFDSAITAATKAEAKYFDFGTSNEDAGRVLNDGLYRFKSEFGGNGVAYEYYELGLE